MALLLTKCGQRVRAEAVSHGSSGGGVAVVEKRPGRADVGYGDGGAAGARRLCSRVLRTAKEAVRAKGRLSGDLSALLGGVLAVDAWRAGPMPAYGRQMGRAAMAGHHAAGSACWPVGHRRPSKVAIRARIQA